MRKQPKASRFPLRMLFLKEALDSATISYNRQGELVFQAIYTRKIGRKPMEQFVVNVRDGSAMFFHLVWDQELNAQEGDWTAVDALAVGDLDELYETADSDTKELLDDHRWEPI